MSETRCIFCRVVAGEIPAEVVHASEGAVAFLDVQPLADGHVLVVPRRHVSRVQDLDAEDAAAVFRAVAALSGPVARATRAEGLTIGVNDGPITGQTVPHVHVHVVPRHRDDGATSIHGMFAAGARRPLAELGAAIRRAMGESAR
jgi:histidine triad (HIT) family protein